MIHELNTGYQLPETDLSAIDKKALFNGFAKTRYVLRRLINLTRQLSSMRQGNAGVEAIAIQDADLVRLRLVRKVNSDIDQSMEKIDGQKAMLAESLLDTACWIDQVATLDEKAALLGLSTTAARRALEPYASRNEEKRESFTMLLTRGGSDPDIEDAVFDVMVDKIMDHPILHRRARQIFNDAFGEDIMPMPDTPQPTLVKTGRAA